jgi:hypothetical protein
MLELHNRFVINDAECASKVVDGEAVIINLTNGTYYSLDKAGAHIWEQLLAGQSIDEVRANVETTYDVTSEQAQADIATLVAELIAEQLLLPASASTNGAAHAASAAPSSRLEYVRPSLTTYRDMADLLALDPPLPRLEDVVWNEPELPGPSSSHSKN